MKFNNKGQIKTWLVGLLAGAILVTGGIFTAKVDNVFAVLSNRLNDRQFQSYEEVGNKQTAVRVIAMGGMGSGLAIETKQDTMIASLATLVLAVHAGDSAGSSSDEGFLMIGAVTGNGFEHEIVAVDPAGHLQIDILTSALPTGAATSALQSTGNSLLSTGNSSLVDIADILTDIETNTVEHKDNMENTLQARGNVPGASQIGVISLGQIRDDVLPVSTVGLADADGDLVFHRVDETGSAWTRASGLRTTHQNITFTAGDETSTGVEVDIRGMGVAMMMIDRSGLNDASLGSIRVAFTADFLDWRTPSCYNVDLRRPVFGCSFTLDTFGSDDRFLVDLRGAIGLRVEVTDSGLTSGTLIITTTAISGAYLGRDELATATASGPADKFSDFGVPSLSVTDDVLSSLGLADDLYTQSRVDDFGSAWSALTTSTGARIPATVADGLLVEVSNPSGASSQVFGAGTEALAQRVTIANDSTGLLSVDDNGGSLTVDAISWPLPTGAATEATLDSALTTLGDIESVLEEINDSTALVATMIKNVDDVAGATDAGNVGLLVRDDVLEPDAAVSADGDYTFQRVDNTGATWVRSGTVTQSLFAAASASGTSTVVDIAGYTMGMIHYTNGATWDRSGTFAINVSVGNSSATKPVVGAIEVRQPGTLWNHQNAEAISIAGVADRTRGYMVSLMGFQTLEIELTLTGGSAGTVEFHIHLYSGGSGLYQEMSLGVNPNIAQVAGGPPPLIQYVGGTGSLGGLAGLHVPSEDRPHVSGDNGIMGLGVVNNNGTELANFEGDYVPSAHTQEGYTLTRNSPDPQEVLFIALSVSGTGATVDVSGYTAAMIHTTASATWDRSGDFAVEVSRGGTNEFTTPISVIEIREGTSPENRWRHQDPSLVPLHSTADGIRGYLVDVTGFQQLRFNANVTGGTSGTMEIHVHLVSNSGSILANATYAVQNAFTIAPLGQQVMGRHDGGRPRFLPLADDGSTSIVGEDNGYPMLGITGAFGSGVWKVLRVDTSGELQIDVLTSALPTGAATSALQTTANGILTTIDADTSILAGAVSGTEMQVDVLTSALPSGASTSALQSTANGILTTIDADTSALFGTVSGSEQQVDIVASLPAGSNNIGDVDVVTVPVSGTSFFSIKDTAIAAVSQNFSFGFTSRKIIIEAPAANTADVCVDLLGGTAVCPASDTAGDYRLAPGSAIILDDYAVTSLSAISASGTNTINVTAVN